MSPIDPISSAHGPEEINPYLLDALTRKPLVQGAKPAKNVGSTQFSLQGQVSEQGSAVQTPTTLSSTPPFPNIALPESNEDINEALLGKDKAYLENTMWWVLDRAKRYFWQGRYTEAEAQYSLYFRYQLYYGTLTEGWTNEFYGNLFLYNWVKDSGNKVLAATELNNQLLLKILEPYTRDFKPTADPREHPILRGFIEEQQIMGHIPTDSSLGMPLNPVFLEKLAQRMIQVGEITNADSVLKLIQLEQLRGFLKIQQLQEQLPPRPGYGVTPARPQMVNSIFFMLYGLPYHSGVHDVEMRQQLQQKREAHTDFTDMDLTQYFTHQVEPIHKDPDQQEERKKREEKLEAEIEEHEHDDPLHLRGRLPHFNKPVLNTHEVEEAYHHAEQEKPEKHQIDLGG